MSAVGTGKVLEICGGPHVIAPQPNGFRMHECVRVINSVGGMEIDGNIVGFTGSFFDFFCRGEGLVEKPVEHATGLVSRLIGKPMTTGDVLKHLAGPLRNVQLLARIHTPFVCVLELFRMQLRCDRATEIFDSMGRSNIFCTKNCYGASCLVDVSLVGDRWVFDALNAGFAGYSDLDAFDRFFHPDTLTLPGISSVAA